MICGDSILTYLHDDKPGCLAVDEVSAIRFGDEGQCWEMMPLDVFVDHLLGIPEMHRRAVVAEL